MPLRPTRRFGFTPALFTRLFALLMAAASPAVRADTQAVSSGSASASIDFVIKIPLVFRVKVQQQPPLRVTQEDIARGYVETSAPQEVQVTFNVPQSYTLRMEMLVPRFKRVTVSEEYSSRSFGAEGLTLLQPPTPPSTHQASHRFNYRIELPADLQPGDYPWPVAISAAQI